MGINESVEPAPDAPMATGRGNDRLGAIAGLIRAFIEPLMILLPPSYRDDVQAALDKMEEAFDGEA